MSPRGCFCPSRSPLVQTDRVLPDPPSCSSRSTTERTHMCAHVKDPISMRRKRVGFIHSGWCGQHKEQCVHRVKPPQRRKESPATPSLKTLSAIGTLISSSSTPATSMTLEIRNDCTLHTRPLNSQRPPPPPITSPA